MSDSAFSPRAAILVIGGGAFTFLLAIGLMVLAEIMEPRGQVGANAFSRSAIGHHALVAILRRLDVPVAVSRHRAVHGARPGDVVLVAEPPTAAALTSALGALRDAPAGPSAMVLVLPKRTGSADPLQAGRLARSWALPATDVNAVLRDIESLGEAVRPNSTPVWEDNRFGVIPVLDGVQLMTGGLRPVVSAAEGILIGDTVIDGVPVRVVTDPDLLATHGIGDGDNAVLAANAIAELLQAGGRLIVDETVHGFRQDPSLVIAAFQPPLLPATVALVLALVALAWAAWSRFGAPIAEAPRLERGKAPLIEGAVGLLATGQHAGRTLVAYARMVVLDVACHFHAPAKLDAAGQETWLAARARSRGTTVDLDALLARIRLLSAARGAEADIAAAARQLHAFRRELIDGPGRRPRAD